jgi:hypothetical protein
MTADRCDRRIAHNVFSAGLELIPEVLRRMRQRNPIEMADALFIEILGSQAQLLFRAQRHVDLEIEKFDEVARAQGALPADLAQVWMPRIEALQLSLERTLHTMARVKHLLSIGEATPLVQHGTSNVVSLDAHPDCPPVKASAPS